jgi:SulP family sulfate permease
MQDRNRQLDENLLQRTAGPYIWVRGRKSHPEQIWSALPQIADIDSSCEDFSVGPTTDMMPHRGGVLRGLARSLKARDIAIVLAGLRDNVRDNLTAVGAEQPIA